MVLGKDGSDYRDLLQSSSSGGGTRSSHRTQTTNHCSDNDKAQALLLDEEHGGRAALGDQFEDEHHNTDRNNSKASKWWGYLWSGASNSSRQAAAISQQDTNHSDDYASMEHVEGAADRLRQPRQQPQPPTSPSRSSRRRTIPYNDDGDVEAPVYFQERASASSRRPRAIGGTMHQSILRKLPLPTTQEDQIQQDCSFLYRPVDEEQPPPGSTPASSSSSRTNNKGPRAARRALRAVLTPPPHGVATLYRDAQDVLSPPTMAAFHAKYQQLNEPYEPPDDYDHDRFEGYNDYAVTPTSAAAAAIHDLTLEEQQQQSSSRPTALGRRHERQHSYVTDVASQSSLFYQVNGRVMLRLPRDHVRLMVADASVMEPGILSVIQTRRPDDDNTNTTGEGKAGGGMQLEYCLTVPPNLYQQVVSDMTQCATTHPHTYQGGVDLHFYASEHADIKIAIGIMGFIMLILGINTLVFDLN